MSYAQFMAPPPPYEAVAPPRASTTSESAPPYQNLPPQPIVAHDASNTARTPPGASTFTPTTAQKTVPLGLSSTPKSTVAARLPAYRRVGYGRYRTHPYRRPLKWRKVENEEDDMVCLIPPSLLARHLIPEVDFRARKHHHHGRGAHFPSFHLLAIEY